MHRRRFSPALVLAASMPALAGLSGCFQNKPSFASVDLTGADYARDFNLVDHNGRQRSLKDFAGQIVVVFFGFAQCPDVCPTTMAEMVEVRKALGADGARVQSIFITVDPDRDTPEVLKAYMANFDPSFLALRPGSAEQLAALAKDFKVFYRKNAGPTPTSYTIDHTAGSYVYDTRGRLRLFTRHGMGVKALVADLRLLLDQG